MNDGLKKSNCSSNYEKAKKKIEEANKNIKFCHIQGPTGPKGEKGERGPIGPVGPTPTISYAMRYSISNQQALQLQQDVDTIIPLEETGSAFNASYDTANSIDVKESAFYQISYYLSGTLQQDGNLKINVMSNNVLLAGSSIGVNWSANTLNNVSNTIIAALVEGDVVTLNVSSPQAATLTLGANINAVLSITKIH